MVDNTPSHNKIQDNISIIGNYKENHKENSYPFLKMHISHTRLKAISL